LNLVEKILSNRTTVIGYDSISEIMVDEVINSLPNKIVFDEPYNTKTLLRELKINFILKKELSNIIVVDLMQLDVKYTKMDDISKFIKELDTYLYTLIDDECNSFKIRLVILTRTNKSPINSLSNSQTYYRGGNRLLYIADYAVIINNKILEVLKDRNVDYENCQ
jgi:hypothetical protein